MNRYPDPLRVELQPDRKTWRLLAPFSYLVPGLGAVVARAGFETDFASVRPLRSIGVWLLLAALPALLVTPWLAAPLVTLGIAALLLYAAVVDYAQEAATIHDWLYSSKELGRRAADRTFHEALRSSGIARWRAWFMWAGVRTAGASRYKTRRVGE